MKRYLLLLFILVLSACTFSKPTIISTNNFIQTNYDYNCLDDSKTFTEIIICYQAQDKAEKAQNKITNELIQESLNIK